MNHQRFQSGALVVLTFSVAGLIGLIWMQNIALKNVSDALTTLSRSGIIRTEPPSTDPVRQPQPDTAFMEAFRTFSSEKSRIATAEKAAQGMVELALVQVQDCPPEPDGVCGYSLYVYGPDDWEKGGTMPYYFAETAGGPLSFYGPYTGDLKAIVLDARAVGTLDLRR